MTPPGRDTRTFRVEETTIADVHRAIHSGGIGRVVSFVDNGGRITVPAGFNTIVYEPDYVLNAAKTGYVAAANDDRRSTLEFPLPVGSGHSGPRGDPEPRGRR